MVDHVTTAMLPRVRPFSALSPLGAHAARAMAEVECYTAAQIKGALPTRSELLQRLADSFVALSHGRIVLGNPSHLQFEGQEADCCIKSAYKIGATVRACLSLSHMRPRFSSA